MKFCKGFWGRITIVGSLFSLFFLLIACERPNHRGGAADEDYTTEEVDTESGTAIITAESASFYVDNSGGMFGYVERDESQEGGNNFVLAVSNLAQNANFRRDDVEVDYNLINGPRNIVTTPIGNRAQDFINCLNPNCFNQGDISGNDLNLMFQIALENAGNKDISVFISDAIYDIQDKTQPITSIISEGFETRNKFIDRLESENIQTLLVKLESNFTGNYYYGVTTGGLPLNQYRPYYVYIFGKSELLNNYFDDSYLESLAGYVNHTRFFLPTNYQVDYEPSSGYSRKGNFRVDRNDPKLLTDVSSDQRGEFEFSIGVDYSNMPLSDNYLTDINHYDVSGDFEVVSVERHSSDMVTNIRSFEPSHMITLRTTGSPQGIIDIKLLNELPAWVEESHTDDDRNIEGDTSTTFGFKYLTQGIVDAYTEVSDQDYFTTKTVTLSRN